MVVRNTILAVLGAWFAVSSWILSLTGHPVYLWTALVLGVVTVGLAVWTLVDRKLVSWRPYLMSVFGLWFAISPWMLGFGTRTTDAVITLVLGIVMLGLGLWDANPGREASASGTTRHAA